MSDAERSDFDKWWKPHGKFRLANIRAMCDSANAIRGRRSWWANIENAAREAYRAGRDRRLKDMDEMDDLRTQLAQANERVKALEGERYLLRQILHDIAFFSHRVDARLPTAYEDGWNKAMDVVTEKARKHFTDMGIIADEWEKLDEHTANLSAELTQANERVTELRSERTVNLDRIARAVNGFRAARARYIEGEVRLAVAQAQIADRDAEIARLRAFNEERTKEIITALVGEPIPEVRTKTVTSMEQLGKEATK